MPYVDKKKQYEYHKQWTSKNRDKFRAWARALREKNRKFMIEYRLKKGCADCGYKENVDALQFDHVRGTKLGGPHQFASTTSYMMREIEKCDVVCANCHCIRTQQRRRDGKADILKDRRYNSMRRKRPLRPRS
jgi:hypothetical protein